MTRVPTRRGSPRRTATTCAARVLVAAALVLTACGGGEDVEPSASASPSPVATTPSPVPTRVSTPAPAPPTLDDLTAVDLYLAWQGTVRELPPTEPDAVIVEGAADGLVVPDSAAAQWVNQELQLARERGVIVRGDVHAEAIPPIQAAGDHATVLICSSADVRITDVATAEPVSDDAVDTSYTRFEVTYQRIADDWLIESADPSDERECVPPSIEESVAARWEVFTEAWYERDRQGGGPALGDLAQVVTDQFADTLRQLPERDHVRDPAPFTNFELFTATPTTATGRACRSAGLETIEWVLVQRQWQVDFAGQIGQEPTPCQ